MNLMSENNKNDYPKYKNRVYFEDEVIECLSKKGPVRRAQLISDIKKIHGNELGYSLKSINRKLDQMRKTGILVSLKFEELQKYGIKERDARARYLTLRKTLKTKEDIDKAFSYLENDNPEIKKLVLEEISRYEEKYVLDPTQLDVLVEHLDAENSELINALLDIIFRYIDEKKVEPLNKDRLLDKLRYLLKSYPVSPDEYPELRRHITWLLGHYRDNFVIDQLKTDAESLENPSSFVCDYSHPLIAPFIEEHSFELFNFQMEMKLKGKEKASEFISRIKDSACNPKNTLEGIVGAQNMNGFYKGIKGGKK